MEYKIVTGSEYKGGTSDFENNINELIKKGWELQGGVSAIFYESSAAYFYQALIKK